MFKYICVHAPLHPPPHQKKKKKENKLKQSFSERFACLFIGY